MPHLIEVAFKGNRKEFFLWEADDLPPIKAALVVEADRGEDLGRVHATGELAEKRSAGVPHGLGAEGAAPPRKALRLATADDVKRAAELTEQNESARRRAMERVKANGLVMKLTDAEWQWDRKKLTFYFTAEKRVDFRNLVRDLASMFRTRIELKQIGVRDEARRLDGIGRCGRQYCSSSWLPELRPVNLGVAKDQRLSLNPTQISGACGRLMCCLRYEHEFYVQSRKRFPKEGKILVTSLGEEKVVANDIFNERVTLRRPDGDARVVPLADLKREIAAAGGDAAQSASPGDAADVADVADTDVEDASADDATETSLEASSEERGGPPAGVPERRHERRPEGRRNRPPERRPSAPPAEARDEPRPGDAGTSASPPAATPAGNGGSWLRQRSPLPQVTPPPAGAAVPTAPTAPVAAPAGVAAAPSPPIAAAAPAPADATPAASGVDVVAPEVASDGAAAAPAAPSNGEESERRTRRRRGRRGGRRGRGGRDGGSGGGPAGGAAASATSPGGEAGDDDDNDADDGGAEGADDAPAGPNGAGGPDRGTNEGE